MLRQTAWSPHWPDRAERRKAFREQQPATSSTVSQTKRLCRQDNSRGLEDINMTCDTSWLPNVDSTGQRVPWWCCQPSFLWRLGLSGWLSRLPPCPAPSPLSPDRPGKPAVATQRKQSTSVHLILADFKIQPYSAWNLQDSLLCDGLHSFECIDRYLPRCCQKICSSFSNSSWYGLLPTAWYVFIYMSAHVCCLLCNGSVQVVQRKVTGRYFNRILGTGE